MQRHMYSDVLGSSGPPNDGGTIWHNRIAQRGTNCHRTNDPPQIRRFGARRAVKSRNTGFLELG